MREIKFRVFDNGKIYYFSLFDLDSNYIVDNSHSISKEAKKNIMQYTGLKDKNDVEIYEGDVIKVGNGSINGRIMFQIYKVEYKLPYGFSKSLPLFCWDENGVYHGGFSHSCEVIGNIHENKELLDD